MKKLLADLLLVAGVVVATLSAAESRRVSKVVPLSGDLSGEVLHQPVSSALREQHPDVYVYADRTLAPGTPLDADAVAWLRGLGLTSVSVLRQPRASETLPVAGDAALGRVLAEPVILTAEPEAASAGRLIDEGFVARLEASELDVVRISVATTDGKGRREVHWDLRDASKNPSDCELVGAKLALPVTVPVRLKRGSYLDEETLARLAQSGYADVDVKIPLHFDWRRWELRWVFAFGVALTLAGVLLKRGKQSAAEVEAGAQHVGALRGELVGVRDTLAKLLPRLDHLDAAQLHEAVDPLVAGPLYRFAEGREAIRTAHGTRTYLAVMDAFARAERKVNRAWSAAVDGYPEEARDSLRAALPPLEEACAALPGSAAPPGEGLLTPDGALRVPPDVPHFHDAD
ncbi:MAG: hypothetical protein H6828_08505 [Planctomycetes bacterium]|nr:hypothetical protein [Planctomycetota bacterium]